MARANINSNYVVDAECALLRQDTAKNQSVYYGRVLHDRTGGNPPATNFGGTAWSVLAHNEGDPGAVIVQAEGTAPYNFNTTDRVWLWEGEFTVTHRPDGTHPGFLFMGSRVMSNPPGGAATATQRVYPPRIPRASTPSVRGGAAFDAGTQVTIDTNWASDTFRHDLSVSLGSYSQQIASKVGGAATWTPPLSLLEQFPEATSMQGTIWCETFSGSTSLGIRSIQFTLRAPASATPSITSLTVLDDNPDVASLVGAFVQGMSILKATVNAAGVYGSTIRSSTFSVDGKSVPSGWGIPLDIAGTRQVLASAIDSRGRSASTSGEINVLAYSPPAAAVQVRRAIAAGTASETGTYLRADVNASVASLLVAGAQKNALTIRVFTREVGSSTWVARNVINATGLTYNSNFVINAGGVFDITKAYDVRVDVSDKFGTSSQISQVATSVIALDIDGNNGVGIGKYRTQGMLDVAGPIYQQNSPVLDTATIRDLPQIPWAAAAGVANHPAISTANGTTVNITFPTGRFTQPPILALTSRSQTQISFAATTVTATGATISIANWESAAAAAGSFSWQAIQMTPGSAAG